MRKNYLLRIFVLIILIFLFIINNVYAKEMDIDKWYHKVETEDGVFYKRNKIDIENVTYAYFSTNSTNDEKYENLREIVREKVNEYVKYYTLDECPEEKRIEKEINVSEVTLYLKKDDGSDYEEGDDIIARVNVNCYPQNSDSNYWKENIPSYQQQFDEVLNKNRIWIYYFVRLSVNQENGEYEISYIDFKPEGYDEYKKQLKEKGIDLDNLDLEKIFNISYQDDVTVVANNAQKLDHNSSRNEELTNNITIIIRAISVLGLLIIILMCLIIRLKYNFL